MSKKSKKWKKLKSQESDVGLIHNKKNKKDKKNRHIKEINTLLQVSPILGFNVPSELIIKDVNRNIVVHEQYKAVTDEEKTALLDMIEEIQYVYENTPLTINKLQELLKSWFKIDVSYDLISEVLTENYEQQYKTYDDMTDEDFDALLNKNQNGVYW